MGVAGWTRVVAAAAAMAAAATAAAAAAVAWWRARHPYKFESELPELRRAHAS